MPTKEMTTYNPDQVNVASTPSCPCCRIYYLENLFLPVAPPPSTTSDENNKVTNKDNVSRTTIALSNSESTSSQLGAAADDDGAATTAVSHTHNNNNNEITSPIACWELLLPQQSITSDMNEQNSSLLWQQQPSSATTTTSTTTSDESHVPTSSKMPIVLVDTHVHAHLRREPDALYHYMVKEGNHQTLDENTTTMAATVTAAAPAAIVSVTCAVHADDWESCLQYVAAAAAETKTTTSGLHHRVVPALGVHPWYLADLSDHWCEDLERLLQLHPRCMVGEVGLCKVAQFVRTYPAGKTAALQLQRDVMWKQLQLAVQYQRPVSIHCVQQQGVLLEMLQQLSASTAATETGKSQPTLPPAMALHSFTGTAHHVKQLLAWEKQVTGCEIDNDDVADDATTRRPPLLYFGFSHLINVRMCSSDKSRRQTEQAIRAVPKHRLLAESDVHHSSNVAVGTAGAIAYLALARGESIQVMADITRRNGLRFLQSLLV